MSDLIPLLGGGFLGAVLAFIIAYRKLPFDIKKVSAEADGIVVEQAKEVLSMQGDHLTIVVEDRQRLAERVEALERQADEMQRRLVSLSVFIRLNPQYDWPEEFVKILQGPASST